MFPYTKVPFWYHFFEPQPFAFLPFCRHLWINGLDLAFHRGLRNLMPKKRFLKVGGHQNGLLSFWFPQNTPSQGAKSEKKNKLSSQSFNQIEGCLRTGPVSIAGLLSASLQTNPQTGGLACCEATPFLRLQRTAKKGRTVTHF